MLHLLVNTLYILYIKPCEHITWSHSLPGHSRCTSTMQGLFHLPGLPLLSASHIDLLEKAVLRQTPLVGEDGLVHYHLNLWVLFPDFKHQVLTAAPNTTSSQGPPSTTSILYAMSHTLPCIDSSHLGLDSQKHTNKMSTCLCTTLPLNAIVTGTSQPTSPEHDTLIIQMKRHRETKYLLLYPVYIHTNVSLQD